MSDAMTDPLTFLRTRRSRPQKLLTAPVPDRDTVMALLEIAARAPDHGKLEPWRFIVLDQAALRSLAGPVRAMAQAAGQDADKAAFQFETSDLAVVVVEVRKDSPKIPAIEQTYSAGAVCMQLINAALAAGWGANWLSGWPSHQRDFCTHLGLDAHETVAGLVHIGTGPATMPDRPRPDIAAITRWFTP